MPTCRLNVDHCVDKVPKQQLFALRSHTLLFTQPGFDSNVASQACSRPLASFVAERGSGAPAAGLERAQR